MMFERLALGTVQFGLPYGIANRTGQINRAEVSDIIRRAKTAGIDTLDTAIAYGESEQCLGEVGVNEWRVITKLPEIPTGCGNIAKWVEDHIQGSLNRLGLSSLTGLLLHRPRQLLESGKEELWPTLMKLKCDGVIQKVGYSIYAPDELDKLWKTYKPDLVQLPFNIFDRRLVTSGWLNKMHESYVEVHVRSVFLQGLLLMDKKNRPAKFNRWSEQWDIWGGWLQECNISPLKAALAFALSDKRISRVVIGVDSLIQFEEILSATDVEINDFPEDLSNTDPILLNPSQWFSL
jgi:aryl-alcohol dehydrogenase-like predicted oxidoreductase